MNTAIVLFVYNRPEHTRLVLEGLKKNKVNHLYVYCDGVKKIEDENDVKLTKKLIDEIDWCKVTFFQNEKNLGLANSIISGITNIFKKDYESVIILEDDCVPSENFIEFMLESLEYYKDIEEVMHISGFGLPIKKYTKSDVYFTPYPCSWGWGTWKDVWNGCDFYQTDKYKNLLNDKKLKNNFNYAGEAFSEFLKMQLDGEVNSWLIRWYYYIFENSGRCLWSYSSLIENKGFDGSGVHKNKVDRFNQKDKISKRNKRNIIFENDINYNSKLIREFRRHFMGKKIIERVKTLFYLLTGIIIGK